MYPIMQANLSSVLFSDDLEYIFFKQFVKFLSSFSSLFPVSLKLKQLLTTLLQQEQFLYSRRYHCVPSRLLTLPGRYNILLGLENTTSYLAWKIQHLTRPGRYNILLGLEDTTSYLAWTQHLTQDERENMFFSGQKNLIFLA